MNLPENLPSSIYFVDTGEKEKPKAKIKYYIKAYLQSEQAMMSFMFYKQVLVIREKPVALKTQDVRGETVTLRDCCCCSKGSSTINTVFDKN